MVSHSCYNFSSVYMHALCMHLSGFVQAITSTFINGFQNNLAQVFSLPSRSAILNICSGQLKIKVGLEGQLVEWS